MQYNETFGTEQKAGGADSNGIDADRATTGPVIQYNYVHDNGDGILLCQFAFGDSIVRYNVLINNSRHGINLHSDAAATNQTYNNLIFIEGLGSANLIATSGDAPATRSRPATRSGTTSCARRARRRWSSPAAASRTQQPLLRRRRGGQRPADGRSAVRQQRDPPERRRVRARALSQLAGFQVRAGSPAIDNGVSITGNGGVDFWGGPLYARADIGPYEAP